MPVNIHDGFRQDVSGVVSGGPFSCDTRRGVQYALQRYWRRGSAG